MNTNVSTGWLSIKIWLLALLLNTILGTIILMILDGGDLMMFLLIIGASYGFVVSLPAPIILYLLFERCSAYKMSGDKIWRVTVMAAVGCGLIAWLLYMVFFQYLHDRDWLFLPLAILSGVAAISIQRRNVVQLGSESTTIEEFLS